MTTQRTLPLTHALLALAVVAVWGSNFAVIKIALGHLPPLLFATLRFAFAVFPAIFFIKRPPVPWRHLAAYGALIGAGQFGILYVAINGHIAAGLASLVVQTQVFFTIILSILIERENVRPFQWAALLLAATGIGVIALHTDGDTDALGIVLVLIAAMSWAAGNLVAKRSGKVNMLAYVVWASPFSVLPLLAVSLMFEGPHAIVEGLRQADATTWAAVLWQSIGNTLFGYVAWGWLLARHPAAIVVPSALLVPVFGMGTTALVLAEPLPAWKLIAAALVISGLALNILWPVLRRTES